MTRLRCSTFELGTVISTLFPELACLLLLDTHRLLRYIPVSGSRRRPVTPVYE